MTALPWSTARPLIGVVHLGLLPGQDGSPGLDPLLDQALADARDLEAGGADALLLENWKDESPGPFVGPETVAVLAVVTRALLAASALPLGVNVLPNDYRTAFALASLGARFVQLDVFSDPVRTDYSYSPVDPFEVRVDPADVAGWRARLGGGAALLASVHPKHYTLLEPGPIEDSARAALREGADAVVVTGSATGSAPALEDLARVKRAVDAPVIIGSGLTVENAAELLAEADGAIVGTALRTPDFSRVVPAQVEAMARAMRS